MGWPAARHGTRSGYNRHRRLGEDPCAECSAANRRYNVEYQHARKSTPRQVDVRTQASTQSPPVRLSGADLRRGYALAEILLDYAMTAPIDGRR